MLTFNKDLGMQHAAPNSKVKRRVYQVLCSGCDKPHKIQASQFKAGYTEYCKGCSLKKKKGEL